MKKKIIFTFFTLLILTGCQKEELTYTWNDYNDTSIAYGMYGSVNEIREKHKTELEKIIEDSKSKNVRVAPGIYAEYAQVLFDSNKRNEAKQYFVLEKTTYPESTLFIDKVLIKLYGSK